MSHRFCFLFRITSFQHESGFLRRSTLTQLTDVGGHVRVQRGRVATPIRLLTALWSSPGRSYTASNSVWFVVKQTASDLGDGGGGRLYPLRKFRKAASGNVGQPPPTGLLKALASPAFGFGCLISVCNDININNMSDSYAKLTNPCGFKSKQPFLIIIVVFHRNRRSAAQRRVSFLEAPKQLTVRL